MRALNPTAPPRTAVRAPLDAPLPEASTNDRRFVTALSRGLVLLRCFTPTDRMLGNRELVERSGLPKATVARLAWTLCELGYLNAHEKLGKYSLGTGVLSLGYALLSNMHIRQVAQPGMQALAEHAQGSVSLGARDRLGMVYLENARSSATITLRLDVGSRIPIATTAMGRAFLCGLRDRERDFLLDAIKDRHPEDWPKLKRGIEQARRDLETRGFVMSIGEWQRDVSAVGVPLLAGHELGLLALNCGGPAFHFKRAALENDLGPRLVALARNVQAALGRG